jgi:hypothetical protein
MTIKWAHRVEAETLKTADNHRETWDLDDLEFVAAFRDETNDEELAVTLGRSLYAVQSIKRVLDERITREVAVRNVTRTETGWTFIGDDVPPGWND